MKTFIYFIVFFFSSAAHTAVLETQIDHIDHGEPDLAMLENGQVAILPENFEAPEGPVRITINDRHEIIHLERLPEGEPSEEVSEVETSYKPTILNSYEEARAIFSRQRRGWQRDSQCYNRAHVWAYEEHRRTGLNSMKVFIFYTRRYIRDYNFYWWFHAVPATYVGSVLYTLDRLFASSPLTINPWVKLFVVSGRTCPMITRYSDYSNHQESEHCYIHLASQYFWQPRDLDRYERTGEEKTRFLKNEIDHAYWEAF